MILKRSELTKEEKASCSINICNQILNEIVLITKPVIHSYIPMGDEVDVMPLLKRCIENGYIVVSSKSIKRPKLVHLEMSDVVDLEKD